MRLEWRVLKMLREREDASVAEIVGEVMVGENRVIKVLSRLQVLGLVSAVQKNGERVYIRQRS